MTAKPQRIRDPLHDMIAFGEEEFERTMWNVVQTRPFQRLRRVRQLGFSEFTFPGATHTRFAHSLGVFHTARQLMELIEEKAPAAELSPSKAQVAKAAALVHDVGHGMFSHAFENVAKELDLALADHETVSAHLIRDSEISEALGSGGVSPDQVATLIGRKGPADLYDAVVSSQFDADRLDYMRRDRLMCGVQSGGIDFTWLVKNLELGRVASSSGEATQQSGAPPDTVMTFVLGPKAIMAAEAYVLALFQLYPTVYFHKTTRAAEMVFKALMVRVFRNLVDGSIGVTGLPDAHPFVRLASHPSDMETILALDDTVFWGSLLNFEESADEGIRVLANCLKERKLPKLPRNQDIGLQVNDFLSKEMPGASLEEKEKVWTKISVKIRERTDEWCAQNDGDGCRRIFFDSEKRDPYSTNQNKGRLNRIHVMEPDGTVTDIRQYSPMIAALEPYRFMRAYTFPGDDEASGFLLGAATGAIEEEKNVST